MLAFDKRSKDGSAKCNIRAADDAVFVAVFDLDPVEKPLLDQAEGLGYGYDEKQILLPGFGTCFYYAASDSHIQSELTPYSWYKELVIVGLEHHHAPHAYLEKVRAVACAIDSDAHRHHAHMQIVAAARRSH